MRIGIDLRMIGGGSGLDRYMTELFHKVLIKDTINEYILFFRDESQTEKFREYGKKMVVTGIGHYSFAEQARLPFLLLKEKLDLVHFPHFNAPLLYRKKFVVTIHDLTHTLIPGKKKSRFFHRLAYDLVFRNAVYSSAMIISVSEATKKAIMDYFTVKAEKITVIYEGINQTYRMIDKDEAFLQVSNRFKVNKSYILYVGEWRRYKNLPQLAKVFNSLAESGHDIELVLVGAQDPFYLEIPQQIFGIRHRDRIKALGRISDEDLNLVYNAASLFVLPSKMEGFGLTVLEAAVCGIPIACSDIPSLREVAGQAAEYFDPENQNNMEDVINNILTNPHRMEELSNLALSRSKHFSWTKAADETLALYRSAADY